MSKTNIKISILPGDGIGPEIMAQALRVFKIISNESNFSFLLEEGLIGGAAYDKFGVHFPEVTKELVKNSDVVLFGAVGGPVDRQHEEKWKGCEVKSILALRKELKLYANIRPVSISDKMISLSPLKLNPKKLPDLVIVRELLGDIYFGEKKRFYDGEIQVAEDICRYDSNQIERISHFAFLLARSRNKKISSVDKANVLETSRLWREVVAKVSKEYPDVELENILVDNCAMQLITRPETFDVLLCPNLFGDILSDAAAVIPGTLGVLSSASIGENDQFLFEPPSGSAPDIAGLGVANPIGMIECVSSIFKIVTKEFHLSNKITNAIDKTLDDKILTKDLIHDSNTLPSSTVELVDRIISHLGHV